MACVQATKRHSMSAAIVCAAAVALFWLALVPSAFASSDAGLSLSQTVVVSGLKHPWDMALLSQREALVSEKDGGLVRVDLASGAVTPILGFPSDLDNVRRGDPRDNSGMFGVALDPVFARNGLVYVAYSAGDAQGTVLRVVRARLRGDTLDGVREVFRAKPLSTDRFHYGGGLAFGADGKLYLTAGERIFNETDQPAMPVAQDSSDMRGKIYRLNPDGTIPADNPGFGPGAVAGLYAVGIRAAQGITRHPRTGALWFSEHGSVQGDEINLLVPGANYGWPQRTTGSYRSQTYRPPALADRVLTEPKHVWSETVAPTGLTFYDHEAVPEWHGDLFVAGLSRGSLWRLDVDGERITGATRVLEGVRLRNVRQSPDGQLYLLTDEKEGRILRVSVARETR
jgi:aldose sugar dehydrogenase